MDWRNTGPGMNRACAANPGRTAFSRGSIACHGTARYVFVGLQGTDRQLSVCEVEVRLSSELFQSTFS